MAPRVPPSGSSPVPPRRLREDDVAPNRGNREPRSSSADTTPPPLPVGLIPGLQLAIPPNLLAPPRTSVSPTSSLFRPPTQQASSQQGLQPIAAPERPTSNAPPATEEERLERQFKEEISQLRILVQRSHGTSLTRARRRLARFEEVERHLATLKIHGQTRRTLRTLLEEGHRRLVRAAIRNNEDDLSQGTRIAHAVENYHRIEERASAVLEVLARLYPSTTTRGIRLEYTGNERNSRGQQAGTSLYEPPLEFMRNLAIVRTYQALRTSTRPEDQAMARAIEGIVSEINAPSLMSDPDNVEFLENETSRLENIYGTPWVEGQSNHVERFFQRVHQTELRDLERNPGFQNRRALQTSLANLTVLSRSLTVLERNPGPISPEALTQTRTALLQTARTLQGRLTEELRRLESNRPMRTVRYQEDGHWMTEEVRDPNPTEQERNLRARIDRLNGIAGQLERFDSSAPEASTQIQGHMRTLIGYEEEQLRSYLHTEANLTNHPNLAQEVEASLQEPLPQRLEHYQRLLDRTDTALMRQTVQARIDMYRAMIPTVRRTDRTFSALSLIGGGPGGVDTTGGYTILIERYEHVRHLIDSGHVNEAQRELSSLEQAQFGAHLQGQFEASGHINMATSIGIIAASAMTMNVAGLTLFPELALSAEAAGAAWTTRLAYTAATAPFFRLTHNSLDAWLSGDLNVLYRTPSEGEGVLENVADNALRFSGQTVNDVGMMFSMQTALRGFQGAAQARLMRTAENQLVSEGALQFGPRSMEELAQVSRRAAQLAEGGLRQTAMAGGAFATELTALQSWGFLDANFQNALQRRFDPGSALRQTFFSGRSWIDQAVFILGMRAGHSLTAPFFGPINEAARDAAIRNVRAQYDQTMTQIRTAGEQWRNHVESGEGNPVEVLQSLQSALEARQRLAENPALRGAVDPQSYAAAQQTLDVVRAQLERTRTPRPQETRPSSGPIGSWIMGLGMMFMGVGGIGMPVVARRTTRRHTPPAEATARSPEPAGPVQSSQTGTRRVARPAPSTSATTGAAPAETPAGPVVSVTSGGSIEAGHLVVDFNQRDVRHVQVTNSTTGQTANLVFRRDPSTGCMRLFNTSGPTNQRVQVIPSTPNRNPETLPPYLLNNRSFASTEVSPGDRVYVHEGDNRVIMFTVGEPVNTARPPSSGPRSPGPAAEHTSRPSGLQQRLSLSDSQMRIVRNNLQRIQRTLTARGVDINTPEGSTICDNIIRTITRVENLVRNHDLSNETIQDLVRREIGIALRFRAEANRQPTNTEATRPRFHVPHPDEVMGRPPASGRRSLYPPLVRSIGLPNGRTLRPIRGCQVNEAGELVVDLRRLNSGSRQVSFKVGDVEYRLEVQPTENPNAFRLTNDTRGPITIHREGFDLPGDDIIIPHAGLRVIRGGLGVEIDLGQEIRFRLANEPLRDEAAPPARPAPEATPSPQAPPQANPAEQGTQPASPRALGRVEAPPPAEGATANLGPRRASPPESQPMAARGSGTTPLPGFLSPCETPAPEAPPQPPGPTNPGSSSGIGAGMALAVFGHTLPFFYEVVSHLLAGPGGTSHAAVGPGMMTVGAIAAGVLPFVAPIAGILGGGRRATPPRSFSPSPHNIDPVNIADGATVFFRRTLIRPQVGENAGVTRPRWQMGDGSLPAGTRSEVRRDGRRVPNDDLRDGDVIRVVRPRMLMPDEVLGEVVFREPAVRLTPAPGETQVIGQEQMTNATGFADLRISPRHMTVARAPDGSILVLDGARTREGGWELSGEGILTTSEAGRPVTLDRGGFPAGTPRTLLAPPEPLIIPPGESRRLRIGDFYVEVENPPVSPQRQPASLAGGVYRQPGRAPVPVQEEAPVPPIRDFVLERPHAVPGNPELPIPEPGHTQTVGRAQVLHPSASEKHLTLERRSDGTLIVTDGAITEDGNHRPSTNGTALIAYGPDHASHRVRALDEPVHLYPGQAIYVSLGGAQRHTIRNPLPSLSGEVAVGERGVRFGQFDPLRGRLTFDNLHTATIPDANAEILHVRFRPHGWLSSVPSKYIYIPVSRAEALRLGWIVPIGENTYRVNPVFERTLFRPLGTGPGTGTTSTPHIPPTREIPMAQPAPVTPEPPRTSPRETVMGNAFPLDESPAPSPQTAPPRPPDPPPRGTSVPPPHAAPRLVNETTPPRAPVSGTTRASAGTTAMSGYILFNLLARGRRRTDGSSASEHLPQPPASDRGEWRVREDTQGTGTRYLLEYTGTNYRIDPIVVNHDVYEFYRNMNIEDNAVRYYPEHLNLPDLVHALADGHRYHETMLALQAARRQPPPVASQTELPMAARPEGDRGTSPNPEPPQRPPRNPGR